MSYIPHNFRSGDTLYAADLNEMDRRIECLSNGTDLASQLELRFGDVHAAGRDIDHPNPSANTCFAHEYIPTNISAVINWDASAYKALPVYFNADHEFAAMGGWSTAGTLAIEPTTHQYALCVIEFRRIDNANFGEGELEDIKAVKVVPANLPYNVIIDIDEDITGSLEIRKNCIIHGNGHTLDATGENFGLHISEGVNVDVYDLHIVNASAEACVVSSGCTCNFYGCSFNDTKENENGGNGLQAAGANIITNCFNCVANGNANDGFNYHGIDSFHTLINCTAGGNGGDGASNHDLGSRMTVNGGVYINNGKAGLAIPTYGGDGYIANAYMAGNMYGLQIYNGETTDQTVVVQNCAIVDSSSFAIQISGYKVTTANNVYKNNAAISQIMHSGSLTDIGSREIALE